MEHTVRRKTKVRKVFMYLLNCSSICMVEIRGSGGRWIMLETTLYPTFAYLSFKNLSFVDPSLKSNFARKEDKIKKMWTIQINIY